jgi:CheY-like chemotaxis protein
MYEIGHRAEGSTTRNSLNHGLEFQRHKSVMLGAKYSAQPFSSGGGCGCDVQAKETVLFDQSQISIVDDDRSFRDSMRMLLNALNYTVVVFPSAAEFLASPTLAATACLVADVQMPAMTGVELYEHLIATGHAIPTILVTAYPNDDVRERMLTLGVECYMPKPLVEAELIDCLRSAVRHGREMRG